MCVCEFGGVLYLGVVVWRENGGGERVDVGSFYKHETILLRLRLGVVYRARVTASDQAATIQDFL